MLFLILSLCSFNYIEANKSEYNLELLGKVIYIDPGHGGRDSGTTYGKLLEKNINLEISKVLEENLEQALMLTDEMLRTSEITDVKRLTEIVAQMKARLQVSLSSSGHMVAAMRSMMNFSPYAYYQDALHGIAFYRFICETEQVLKKNPDYREAMYVEHFYSKEYLNKMIVAGLLLMKKGKYRF